MKERRGKAESACLGDTSLTHRLDSKYCGSGTQGILAHSLFFFCPAVFCTGLAIKAFEVLSKEYVAGKLFILLTKHHVTPNTVEKI